MKFTREQTEYTITRGLGPDEYLLLCTYEQEGKTKWLVVKDTDDMSSTLLYPDQSDIKGIAYDFMDKFVASVNKELDKKHAKAPEDPQTANEWVDHIVGYKLSFDGTHLKIEE